MMTSRIYLILAFCLGFGALVASSSFAADQATEMAKKNGDVGASQHDLVQGTHVEGHIAFLRAELAITPGQEALWEPVAAAMRDDVTTLQAADAKISQTHAPQNAVDYLQNRVVFANLRAQGEERFLNAFRGLYGVLSPQQKQMADSLFIPDMTE
jgi:hypothetical protein